MIKTFKHISPPSATEASNEDDQTNSLKRGLWVTQDLVDHRPVTPENIGNSEAIRLEIFRALIRQCADPSIRLIERSEAISLCQNPGLPSQGSLLVELAERIQTPVEIVQKDLLTLTRQPATRLDPFVRQLRTSGLEDHQSLLRPYGILPCLRNDRLLTVLAEIPSIAPFVIRLCGEQGLSITWCHVIVVKIKNLLAHLSCEPGTGCTRYHDIAPLI